MVTFEIAHELLRYDPETGKLFWRPREGDPKCNGWNNRFAGKEALTALDDEGYQRGSIQGMHCKAHRIIWLLQTGSWPADQIDHINGIRTDNRICNLRAVSNQENCRNRRRRDDNVSGYTGVSWHKRDNRWEARIKAAGQHHHLGLFANLDDAVAARKQAEKKYGFHANHGRA